MAHIYCSWVISRATNIILWWCCQMGALAFKKATSSRRYHERHSKGNEESLQLLLATSSRRYHERHSKGNEEWGCCHLFSCLFSCLCFRCCFNLSCRAGLLALGRKGCRPQKYHERYLKRRRNVTSRGRFFRGAPCSASAFSALCIQNTGADPCS